MPVMFPVYTVQASQRAAAVGVQRPRAADVQVAPGGRGGAVGAGAAAEVRDARCVQRRAAVHQPSPGELRLLAFYLLCLLIWPRACAPGSLPASCYSDCACHAVFLVAGRGWYAGAAHLHPQRRRCGSRLFHRPSKRRPGAQMT